MIKDYFNKMVQELFLSRVVSSFKVLKREASEEDGYIRVKCNLSDGGILEFAEYVYIYKKKVHTETYSYHWQTTDGTLIKRWDNVPHHKGINTFPHHLHLSGDKVIGVFSVTLKKILIEIEKIIPISNE